MTAEVQERHRRAALEFLNRAPGSHESQYWARTGSPSRNGYEWTYEGSLAQRFADAEERGRIEERVRCLAWARNMEKCGLDAEAVAIVIRDADVPHAVLLDAARKELGE